jgi:hypothetical protein
VSCRRLAGLLGGASTMRRLALTSPRPRRRSHARDRPDRPRTRAQGRRAGLVRRRLSSSALLASAPADRAAIVQGTRTPPSHGGNPGSNPGSGIASGPGPERRSPARPVRYLRSPPAARGCGGIGRRARFRSVSEKSGGGSSPLIRTRQKPSKMALFCFRPALSLQSTDGRNVVKWQIRPFLRPLRPPHLRATCRRPRDVDPEASTG